MPTGIVPLSVRLAAFHRDLRDWHREMARKHGRRGHERAEQDHLEAAAAHEAAMAAPFDKRLPGAAMRASSIADEASQKVGVRPLLPWPRR
jgi:hypothetical protein